MNTGPVTCEWDAVALGAPSPHPQAPPVPRFFQSIVLTEKKQFYKVSGM